MAHFGGMIVATNRTDWAGRFLHVAVKDAGSPGSSGDQIWTAFMSREQCMMHMQEGGGHPLPAGGPYVVTGGNLTVY